MEDAQILSATGQRFEDWAQIEKAVEGATAYWNAHKHPYIWGRRRRRKPKQTLGIASVPFVAAA